MKVKIDGTNRDTTNISSLKQTGTHKIKGLNTSFSETLNSHEQSLTRQELERLLQEIDKQAARLSRTPTYDELKSYRNLVKTFVEEAVEKMYTLDVRQGFDSRGRQKIYTTVRLIDEELDKLADKIRTGQKDALTIVDSQDAIRGLLIDLYQ